MCRGPKTRPRAPAMKTSTFFTYEEAENRIEAYFERWDLNLDTCNEAATVAYLNIKEILKIPDPAKISWGWVIFDFVLQIALPGIGQVTNAYKKLSERYEKVDKLVDAAASAKTVADHWAKVADKTTKAADDLARGAAQVAKSAAKAADSAKAVAVDTANDLRFLNDLVYRGAERIYGSKALPTRSSASAAITTELKSYQNIIQAIADARANLQQTKENMRKVLLSLFRSQGNNLDPESEKEIRDLGQPPESINKKLSDIIYVYEWEILCRYVVNNMRLEIKVFESTNTVWKYEPSPLSETACQVIFKHFDRTIDLSKFNMDPERKRKGTLHAVTSWEAFADTWACDVKITKIGGAMGHARGTSLHPRLVQRAKETVW